MHRKAKTLPAGCRIFPGTKPATLDRMSCSRKLNRIVKQSRRELVVPLNHDTLSHHEKFDGSGYPAGLHGEDIPLAARIVAIADVDDALRSQRIYKPAFSHDKTTKIIEADAGTHFDPRLVDAFRHAISRGENVGGTKHIGGKGSAEPHVGESL